MLNPRTTARRKLIFALWLAKKHKKAKKYTYYELINNLDL